MKVELICPEDENVIAQVAELEKAIFSDAWSENEITNTVKQKQAFCAAAKIEEKVLGYFLCYYVLDECEIARIAVTQEARRQGVGAALFEHMLEMCKSKKIERILLDVRAGNHSAIAFYEKNGFEKDGIRKGYYGGKEPEDAVLMSRAVAMLSTGKGI